MKLSEKIRKALEYRNEHKSVVDELVAEVLDMERNWAELEAENARLHEERKGWEDDFGKHLDEYNSWMNTCLHDDTDKTDIPREGKHGKHEVFHTGTGRLAMLIDGYNKMQAENKKLREADAKSVFLLFGWLTTSDDVDMIVHTDRWLRERCNCENELAPCSICESLDD